MTPQETDAHRALLMEIERRLMNAQPTIANASNAVFIDNHVGVVLALLKGALGSATCQHVNAPERTL